MVLELRKSPGWFAIIRFLTPGARHVSFTEDPAKATEIKDEQARLLADSIGERARYQFRWV
jgi:hypothetical protein